MSADKIKDIDQIEAIYEKHYQRMYKHEGTPRETLLNAMKEYAELYHKQQLHIGIGEVMKFYSEVQGMDVLTPLHEVLSKMNK